jgi:hypothetical protein
VLIAFFLARILTLNISFCRCFAERFLGGPVGVKAKSGLRQRCLTLLELSEHFPRIVSDTKTIERVGRIAIGLVGKAPDGKEDALGAGYALALCGWEPAPSALGDRAMLRCAYCRAHMAIGGNDTMRWPPKQEVDPLDDNMPITIGTPKGNGSGGIAEGRSTLTTLTPLTPVVTQAVLKRRLTPKQEAAAAIGSSRRFGSKGALKRTRSTESLQAVKKSRTAATGQVDPTNTHRTFCPYVNEGFKVLAASAMDSNIKSPIALGSASSDLDIGSACTAVLKALSSI